jgi:hypothetical protein
MISGNISTCRGLFFFHLLSISIYGLRREVHNEKSYFVYNLFSVRPKTPFAGNKKLG